ncbi:hypothetical protein IAT38_003832 [Cryptococcus sp. DSM 104549]
MYAVILAYLPSSIDLLVQSYRKPSDGPSILASLVAYDSLLELPGRYGEVGERITVDMAGQCWVGDRSVSCCEGLVGKSVHRLIPFLASYQMFYSLLVFSLLLSGLWTVMLRRNWANSLELKVFRRFILFMMVIKDIVSVCGTVFLGCALMIAPLIDESSAAEAIVDITPGWGFIISTIMAMLSCFFTLTFENASECMLQEEAESGISLSESAPLLGELAVASNNTPAEKPLLEV